MMDVDRSYDREQCQSVWYSGDGQTRLQCPNDAKFKVGRPYESLVRRYMCAEHLHHAIRWFGGLRNCIVFQLPERSIPSDAVIREICRLAGAPDGYIDEPPSRLQPIFDGMGGWVRDRLLGRK